ncbi:MAG TPA: hypothetical protein PKZ36_00875 [Candidatus Paceibacterota bacterium]|nr:hypothetical protein [Candidatus Paceibacterota bacterium]HPT17948.1 hypothetical protein [Candidatus Paceibacterota bacterium]
MDLSQTFNSNNQATEELLFNSKFFDFDKILSGIYNFFINLFDPLSQPTAIGNIVKFILALFSIFFIFIIIYSVIKIFEVRKKEHEYIEHEIAEFRRKQIEKEKIASEKRTGSNNEKWEAVLQYLFSDSPSDWKLSVIEADAMLNELMDRLNFKGENLAEKLKSADRENFKKLSSAWEVHLIRNKIAHEGIEFELSHHEAKRVIALYEEIFREYDFI